MTILDLNPKHNLIPDDGDPGGAPGDGGDGGGTPPGDGGGNNPPATLTAEQWLEQTPDNWQTLIAGEDNESALATLSRVPDLKTLGTNYLNAQERIRTGEIEPLQPPGEDGTDEQWADYRTRMNVPTEAKGYSDALELTDGLSFGEADQPLMDALFEAAHATNVPVGAVNSLVNAVLKAREGEMQGYEAKAEQQRVEAENALRQAWKGAYDNNVAGVKGIIINAMPESVREDFEHAMLPDGQLLFNKPEIMIAFADMARKIDPLMTRLPNNGNVVKTMQEEKAALEAKMGTDEWHKDTASQARYLEIVADLERIEGAA